jgi:hypothetical protein
MCETGSLLHRLRAGQAMGKTAFNVYSPTTSLAALAKEDEMKEEAEEEEEEEVPALLPLGAPAPAV